MPRNITAIDSTRREMPASVLSNVSCAFCSRWRILTDNSSMTPMASAWLASMVLRKSSVRIASCSVSLAIPSRSATVRAFSRCQRHALQVVVGEVGHHGDGLLDRLGVPAGVLGGGRGGRQIIGVGGDQHGRERFAGFSERRPDLRVAMPGGALDDRIQPGHFPGRSQHLLLIGLGDGGLHRAQFAEAVEETVGDVFEPLDRSRQHRVVGGARGERAEHRFAQQQDLGEQFGARLVDVAMDQVLQPAGFAFQQRQDLVGFPHLPDVVPGRIRAPWRRSRSARRAPRRRRSSIPRSTGCASGSAPRAATARRENGRARRSSPAVPLFGAVAVRRSNSVHSAKAPDQYRRHRPEQCNNGTVEIGRAGPDMSSGSFSAPKWREWSAVDRMPLVLGSGIRNSRAKAPVETAVSNSATTSTKVRERSARRYTGDKSP